MDYSRDWNNEIWESLKWLGIASAIAIAAILVIGFLLARFSR